MEKFTKIQEHASNNSGFFLSADCESVGVSRETLSNYVKQGKLERIRRGVYILPDFFEDEMYALQKVVTVAVYSHNTALYLHDLSDRTPLTYEVTIPKGYNGTNLRKSGNVVFEVKKEFHQLGITTVNTMYGNPVKVYNIERTLCDILKPRASMDISVVTDAYKWYVRRKTRNLNMLMQYAQLLGVEKKVRSYMEVLL